MPAPIALFVYNRLWHTRQTVEALLKNFLAAESDLFIFSDGAKNEKSTASVNEVRDYIKSIGGFKSVQIVTNETNKGLAKSIIAGVTGVLQKLESVIVVEDDLVTSPYFLDYMNQALDLYANEDKVISIHGYVYPTKGALPETFFLRGADCWGWATWKRGWQLFEPDGRKLLNELDTKGLVGDFDFDGTYPYRKMLVNQIEGRNDSWAIRWYASAFLKDRLTLYPGVSLVKNIGHDNSGTHSGLSNEFDVMLRSKRVDLEKIPTEENADARAMIINYFKKMHALTFRKVVKRLMGLLKK